MAKNARHGSQGASRLRVPNGDGRTRPIAGRAVSPARHDSGSRPTGGATTVWKHRVVATGPKGHADYTRYPGIARRFDLRDPDAAEQPGMRSDGGATAATRHRREHGHFQRV